LQTQSRIRLGSNRTLREQVKFAPRLSVYVSKPQFNVPDMQSSIWDGLCDIVTSALARSVRLVTSSRRNPRPRSSNAFFRRQTFRRDLDVPRMKKHAAREAACLDRSCPRLSAYVGDALLSICFGRARWLRWQLKHRCLLTLT
jgi:hypothetical protein